MKDDSLRNAQRAIATILAKLEAETGALVKMIRIDDIDVTQIGDRKSKKIRQILITLEHQPGHDWLQ